MIGAREGWVFPPEESFEPDVNELRDFRNFLYLGMQAMGQGAPTARQYEVAYYLQHGPSELLVMAFRGMGKSLITCFFAAWLLFWWPQKRIMLVSASETRALANAQLIRRMLHDWLLLEHLEPSAGDRDNQLAFDVRGAIAMTDTSVRALGVGGQMTGFHADAVLPDDVEVPSNSLTPGAREKLSGHCAEFGGAVLNPNGIVRALGTPQTEDSTYSKFPERGYGVRIWPARFVDGERANVMGEKLAPNIRDEAEADPTLIGMPTDPERYGEAVLERALVKYGRQGFALQFMLDTTLSDDDLYPLRLRDLSVFDLSPEVAPEQVVWASGPERVVGDLQCLGRDGDYFCKPMQLVGEWLPYEGGILAVDPAGRGRDELAWVCVKVLNGQLFLLGLGAEMDGFDALPRVALAAKRFHVNAVVTEANFGGGAYTKLLQDALRDVYPCELIEVNHTTRKEQRILRSIEPVMASHKLMVSKDVLRTDIELAREHGGEGWIYRSLAYQLSRLTGQPDCLPHDDRVDALAIGLTYYSERVEANTGRFIERRKQDQKDEEMRRWFREAGVKGPASLEPNSLASNRGVGFLRHGRRAGLHGGGGGDWDFN